MLDSLYIWYLKTFLPGWTSCSLPETDLMDDPFYADLPMECMTNPSSKSKRLGPLNGTTEEQLAQLIDNHYQD